jgi:hypothetical protein
MRSSQERRAGISKLRFAALGRGLRLACVLAFALGVDARVDAAPKRTREAALTLHPKCPPAALSVPTIDFAELYRFGSRAPEPTEKLLGLQGKRVKVVGFMALLERPVRGGLYLAPYPSQSDESGAGRGDVPPTSILVLPSLAAGKEVAFVSGALEVTGILDFGNRESDGERASLRLLVDAADLEALRFARTRATVRKPGKGDN